MSLIEINSPAKINLFLHVIGKRPDGYHNLFMLMGCISLFDTVFLDFSVKRLNVSCEHPQVPDGETNLAFKAAEEFFRCMGKEDGVRITIKKKIPVGAGLGGGSSNAASVLSGLNNYYGQPLSTDKLMSIGLSIGADVPFFLFGRPAIATGIGEKLNYYKYFQPCRVLLINPGYVVSTAEIYKKLNFRLTKCEKTLKEHNFDDMRFDVERHLHNDLEAVTASIHPDIYLIKKQLVKYGADGALMSGSGPTVFGLFFNFKEAKRAYDHFKTMQWKCVILADLLFE